MLLKSFWVCSAIENKPKTYLDQVHTAKSDASKPAWTWPWKSKNMASKMLEDPLRLCYALATLLPLFVAHYRGHLPSCYFLTSKGPTNNLWVCKTIAYNLFWNSWTSNFWALSPTLYTHWGWNKLFKYRKLAEVFAQFKNQNPKVPLQIPPFLDFLDFRRRGDL